MRDAAIELKSLGKKVLVGKEGNYNIMEDSADGIKEKIQEPPSEVNKSEY